MTIAKTGSETSDAGNGATVAFAFPFRFFDDTDLQVFVVVDSTGVATLQTLTTNYTIVNTGTESGGTVTMVVAPASGETLLIQREIPETQSTDYQNNDAFPAETHEAALDRLTLIAQQTARSDGQHLTFPTGDTSTPILPPSITRADKLMAFDTSGGIIMLDTTAGIAATFDQRSEFVTAVAAGLSVADGGMIIAGPMMYQADGSESGISDLPGYKPFLAPYADHYAENTTPGATDMKAAIELSGGDRVATLLEQEYNVLNRVAAPAVLEMPFGASIVGSDYDLGTKVLANQFLTNVDWSGGTSSYMVRHSGILHNLFYSGDVDDYRKSSFHIFRFYDGKATASRALGGSAILAHVDVGEGSSGDPSSGTNAALEANIQAHFVVNEAASPTRTELTPIAAGVNSRDVGAVQAGINVYNDFVVHGPRSTLTADREGFLAGASFFVAKYTPGNVLDITGKGHDGSYGVNIWTNPGGGGFKDGQLKTGWTSYTMRAGISIGGWAGENGVANDGHSPSATTAYEYGILIGKDAASVWSAGSPNSKLQFGIKVGDFVDVGILLDEKHPDADADAVALAVMPAAGIAVFGNDADGGVSDRIEIFGTAAFTPLAVHLSTGEFWTTRITSGKDYHMGYNSGGGDVFSFQLKLGAPNNALIVGTGNVTIRSPLMTFVPTSSGGLSTGEVWNNSGVLNIV